MGILWTVNILSAHLKFSGSIPNIFLLRQNIKVELLKSLTVDSCFTKVEIQWQRQSSYISGSQWRYPVDKGLYEANTKDKKCFEKCLENSKPANFWGKTLKFSCFQENLGTQPDVWFAADYSDLNVKKEQIRFLKLFLKFFNR